MQKFPEWVPVIRLSTNVIDWDEVTIGHSSERILTINNDGLESLEISSMSCDNPVFSISDQTMSLGGLASDDVVIVDLGCGDGRIPIMAARDMPPPSHPKALARCSGG